MTGHVHTPVSPRAAAPQPAVYACAQLPLGLQVTVMNSILEVPSLT